MICQQSMSVRGKILHEEVSCSHSRNSSKQTPVYWSPLSRHLAETFSVNVTMSTKGFYITAAMKLVFNKGCTKTRLSNLSAPPQIRKIWYLVTTEALSLCPVLHFLLIQFLSSVIFLERRKREMLTEDGSRKVCACRHSLVNKTYGDLGVENIFRCFFL